MRTERKNPQNHTIGYLQNRHNLLSMSGQADETAVRASFRLDSLFLSHQGERKRQLNPNAAQNQINLNFKVEETDAVELIVLDNFGKQQTCNKLIKE